MHRLDRCINCGTQEWRWEAFLEDPPGPVQPQGSLTPGALLAAYYRPLVAALVEAGGDQATDDDAMTITPLPGIDLALGIPTAIVAIIRTLPFAGPITAGQLQDTGAALLREAPARLFASHAETARPDEGDSAVLQEPLRPYTGLDGVYIEPGPSWLRAPRYRTDASGAGAL
jgi:hypothetical protein